MVDTKKGLEPLDFGALNTEQRNKLVEYKIDMRIANEKYLRTHKEVEVLLSGFLREALLQRPGNIREFAADYFTDPDLPKKVQQKLMEKKNETPC